MSTILTSSGLTIERVTVSFVTLHDVFAYMELREEEISAVLAYGFNDVTWGDAVYTLIHGDDALERIVQGMFSYYDELEADADEYGQPSRSLPARIYSRRAITEYFYQVVRHGDYINLEG